MTTRTPTQRRLDTLETLRRGRDAWVASANGDGTAHLIGLAFSWDGERLTVATRERSKTGRNLARARWARVALDLHKDVVIVEGPLEVIPIDADDALADAHAAAIGFDFRTLPESYVFFRLTPSRIQAMRSPEEEPDRAIMRDGRWLDDRITAEPHTSRVA
ncbi:MAG: pyridoxamine 5'-phosphate oxidase family protein [Thermomicrobiales bacterium]